MEGLIDLILLFFAYSMAGWCIEVTLKYIQYHRFINRGFLTGPICPIYGSGAALITVAVGSLTRFESSVGTTFVVSFLVCGILEYLTSYVMEKRYHARWWDYSRKPMNLHGRIWIGNLILFGLGGVAIIHIINPVFSRLINVASFTAREIAVLCLLTIFAADFVMTHFVLRLIRSGIEKSEADNTEEISREIRLLLSDRSIFYRRFADAYPEVIYRTERINARLAAVKAETERILKETEASLQEQKERVMSELEPASMIKNTIIAKQSELIEQLYDEQSATPQSRDLYGEICKEKERLDTHITTRLSRSMLQNRL